MSKVKIENEVINIKNIETENTTWKWITRIGGLMGILLTAIVLYESLIVSSSISLKLVGFTADARKTLVVNNPVTNTKGTLSGYKYLMKLTANVTGNDLNYKDIKVTMTFDDTVNLEATHFYANGFFRDWNYAKKIWVLEIPQEELFLYQTNLEKDKTHLGFVSVFIDDSENVIRNRRPESIKIEFIASEKRFLSNKSKVYSPSALSWDNYRPTEVIHDSRIWTDVRSRQNRIKSIVNSEITNQNFKQRLGQFIKPGTSDSTIWLISVLLDRTVKKVEALE